MAATHLTLEEFAERLGFSPEEFKRRLKTDPSFKILVPIRDGPSLRFKSGALDELARQLGAASDPQLPLSPSRAGFHGLGRLQGRRLDREGRRSRTESPTRIRCWRVMKSLLTSDEQDSAKKGDSDARRSAKPKGSSSRTMSPWFRRRSHRLQQSRQAVIIGGFVKLSAPKSWARPPPASPPTHPEPAQSRGGDSGEFELSLDADSDDFELKLNTDQRRGSLRCR